MAVLDMSLEKLKSYMGSNIKGSDFENYWSKQIKLIDKSIKNIEFELIRKKISNDNIWCYDLVFKSFDGSNIYAKYICPKDKENTPLVLEFHDYMESSGGWFKLSRYAGIGYSVLAMDCRGQGGLTSDDTKVKGTTVFGDIVRGIDDSLDNLYYRNIYLDSYILSKIGEQLNNINSEKIIVSGKGQGASISIFIVSYNKKIKKCVLEAPFLADFKRVIDIDLDIKLYSGLRSYFRCFDPEGIYEEETLEKLSYIDIVNFANEVECEVLMGTGLLDDISPPSTQFAVFNNIKSKNKKHLIFSKYGHEHNNFFENEVLNFINFKN